ncbi:His-rich protein BRANT [Rhodopseudomonas sp.]|uniref:His-rich protein BRANT n=1 Tax=Rhodopseudomonas sp. TaxID=1078 RepID=UPI003B3B6175
MIKSLSAALLAVSMLTAPAFAAGAEKTPAAPAAAATDAAKPAATPMAQTNVAPKAKAKVARHHHRAVHHKLNKQSSLRGHQHLAKLDAKTVKTGGKVGVKAPAKQHLSKASIRPAAPKRG